LKIIDEDKGMVRSEAMRGMIVHIEEWKDVGWGDRPNELFVTDRWLREVFNMAKGSVEFWPKKKKYKSHQKLIQ